MKRYTFVFTETELQTICKALGQNDDDASWEIIEKLIEGRKQQ